MCKYEDNTEGIYFAFLHFAKILQNTQIFRTINHYLLQPNLMQIDKLYSRMTKNTTVADNYGISKNVSLYQSNLVKIHSLETYK